MRLCGQKRFIVLLVAVYCRWAGTAHALPIEGVVVDDPRGDPVGDSLGEELGVPGIFPTNEWIESVAEQTNSVVGVPDDGLPNDWLVFMTNQNIRAFGDPVGLPLYFAANVGNSIGNADGTADWSVPAAIPPGGFADAFHIDSVGMNANLVFESGVFDGIFASGETWGFLVTNFIVPLAPGAPPRFESVGHSIGLFPGIGTASIVVGVPVPEPSTWAMMAFGIGLGGLARSRRRAARA
jgi:hypothetical protein